VTERVNKLLIRMNRSSYFWMPVSKLDVGKRGRLYTVTYDALQNVRASDADILEPTRRNTMLELGN